MCLSPRNVKQRNMINRNKPTPQFAKIVDPKIKEAFFAIGEKVIVNGKACEVAIDKPGGSVNCVKCEIFVSNFMIANVATCANVICCDSERKDRTSIHFERLAK